MSKRALLVGINKFTRDDWALQGCVSDTVTIHQLLTDFYGYSANEIRVLTDFDATNNSICNGLAWLFSDYSGGGNDVRILHLASHGTQIVDSSNDEDDELDEVIVTHDHSWANPMKDDILCRFFDDVPENVSFTFIADCCHSGSINKFVYPPEVVAAQERFVRPPQEMQTRITRLKLQEKEEEERWLAPRLAEARGDRHFGAWLDERESTKSQLLLQLRRKKRNKVATGKPQVLMAACHDEETAAEAIIDGRHRGAFTWSIATAIREHNGVISYGDLMHRSTTLLHSYSQNPNIDIPEALSERRFLSPLV